MIYNYDLSEYQDTEIKYMIIYHKKKTNMISGLSSFNAVSFVDDIQTHTLENICTLILMIVVTI